MLGAPSMRILLRQTRTLIRKTYLLLLRKWFTTLIRALLLPCGVMIFLSYAKYLFFPPQSFGFGQLAPIRSLADTLDGKLVFVRGHMGSEADIYIKRIEENEGITDIIIANDREELTDICLMNLQGSSSCYAAVVFTDPKKSRMSYYDGETQEYSEEKEYDGTEYAYEIVVNPSLRTGMIDIEHANSPIQSHIFPLQYAVDRALAPTLPRQPPRQWGYTSTTAKIQEIYITEAYLRGMARYIYPGIFIGMIGIMYHLPGLFVAEREIGITSLLDAHGCTTIARYLSWHISMSALYLPGWIISSIFFAIQLFHNTNAAIVLFWQILGGLSLTSYAIFLSAFFKRAQLASVTCSTLAMVLVTVMVIVTFDSGWSNSSPAIFIGLSAVFPPINYISFFSSLSGWESGSHGMDLLKTLNDVVPDAEKGYGGPAANKGIIYWIFALIHIVLFPILGMVVEHLFYSTKTQGLRVPLETQQDNGMTPLGIRLTDFTRKYKDFTAVDNLNLTVYQGQIMCLLGSNGSGKTTTLQAIAGIGGITSGKIEIAGLKGSRNSTLSGVGVCPQGNVLWDALTVEEHVKLWAEIKCTDVHHFDDGDIISECDLWKKRKSKSATLSGGQKRKLQLAIMLVGGVEVCCMDEVSSGLDPLSRLKIHEIILANRGQRTILFTTHFLDEADFLSDYIAVISRGKLRCEGTPASLKSKMGNGYKITTTVPIDEEKKWIVHDSTQVAKTLRYIEERGVQDYKVVGPTLEEVFLNVVADAKTVEDEVDGKTSRDSSEVGSFVSALESEDRTLNLSRGQVLNFWREMTAIYGKRWMIIRRSFIPVLCVLFIPIVVAIATRGLLRDYQMDTCIREDQSAVRARAITDMSPRMTKRQLNTGQQETLDLLMSSQVLLAPETFWTENRLTQMEDTLKEILPYSIPTTVSSNLDTFEKKIESGYTGLPLGLYFDTEDPASDIVALNMEIPLYYSAKPLNFLNQLRLNDTNAGIKIDTGVNTFSRADFTPQGLGWGLIFIFFFGFSMALAAAFPTLYPTFERVRKVRALHYSNGVRPAPLWLGHLIYESTWLIVSGIICAVIMATNLPGNWYQAWYLVLIFILYGISGTLFSFVISLFSKSALAAFPAMAGLNAIMHTIFVVVYMVLFTIGSADKLISSLDGVFYGLGIIFPIANVGRALFISLNMFGMSCKPAMASSAGNAGLRPWAGAFDLYGGPICYLVLQSFAFYGFLVWWENGRQVPLFLHRFLTRKSKSYPQDSYQMNSRASMGNNPEKHSLVVDHINKRFGKNQAVDNVSFSVAQNETFCLLGPNGAGKTTTITMVLGELVPDSGDIYVEGKSIRAQRGEARTSLGVCPQFDAIDNLTVKQTLDFYARVKGVPDVAHNVREIIRGVGLTQFVRRKVDKLSGGNKRKLSLGIALMGNPGVLLLDEPSSGMDAGAKRVMWKTLRAVSTGRAIVLTTHSMEESDALADRVGILGGRMLALGTIDQLQESHGRYHHIHVVSANAPHSTAAEMAALQSYIHDAFGETVGAGVLGQIRFKVPESALRIGDVFAKLEAGRELVGIKEFAVAGTTLEDVFLSVSRKYEEDQAAAAALGN